MIYWIIQDSYVILDKWKQYSPASTHIVAGIVFKIYNPQVDKL